MICVARLQSKCSRCDASPAMRLQVQPSCSREGGTSWTPVMPPYPCKAPWQLVDRKSRIRAVPAGPQPEEGAKEDTTTLMKSGDPKVILSSSSFPKKMSEKMPECVSETHDSKYVWHGVEVKELFYRLCLSKANPRAEDNPKTHIDKHNNWGKESACNWTKNEPRFAYAESRFPNRWPTGVHASPWYEWISIWKRSWKLNKSI